MRRDLFRLHAELEARHWWFAGRRRIMARLVRAVLPPADGRLVVDIGCGTGANLAALADGYRCLGIDTSADAIELARERFPGVRFVHGFAPADIEEDVAEAGMLLFMDVIEHVPDDFALVSEVLARARPGTHALITVPANERLWSQHDVSFGHYRRYDAARLAAVWEGLPVRPLLLSYFNSRLYPVVRTVRTLGRLRGHASGRAGTDLSLPPAPLNAFLERFFAGEAGTLLDTMNGRRARGYRAGVSLVALVRREAGALSPRRRPSSVAPDLHDPAAPGDGAQHA